MNKTLNNKFGLVNKYFCRILIFSISIVLFLLQSNIANAQDSIVKVKTKPAKVHSPAKAAWMSTALPGLGQAYNKKYWKIPILYAGLATTAYYIKYNNDKYQTYKRIYKDRLDTNIKVKELPFYTNDNIKFLKDGYRRNMEFTCIIAGLIYVLNIVDASVDAHFYTYDVNENLAIRVQPTVLYKGYESTPSANLTLTYKFKYK